MANDREHFKSRLKELTARFESQTSEMRRHGYDEATLRLEYLDPMFSALGWNVWNEPPQPLHLREVIVENRTELKGRTGRVDYLFVRADSNAGYAKRKSPSTASTVTSFRFKITLTICGFGSESYPISSIS